MTKRIRPTIELICAHTGEKFLKCKAEYDRQLKKGNNLFYKDRKTAGLALREKKRVRSKDPVERICKHCGKLFSIIPTPKSGHFCSRECQSTHNWIKIKSDVEKFQQVKKNFSVSALNAWENIKKTQVYQYKLKLKSNIEKECVICKNKFTVTSTPNAQTCSKICLSKLMSIKAKANPNCGGETNYKKFIYKNQYFDSSWEVEIAKWMDENNVQWIRTKKIMFLWTDDNNEKRRYYPDFFLPKYNIYLDPKNKFLIEKDKIKIERAQKENNIIIVCGLKDYVLNELKSLINKQI